MYSQASSLRGPSSSYQQVLGYSSKQACYCQPKASSWNLSWILPFSSYALSHLQNECYFGCDRSQSLNEKRITLWTISCIHGFWFVALPPKRPLRLCTDRVVSFSRSDRLAISSNPPSSGNIFHSYYIYCTISWVPHIFSNLTFQN